MYGHRSREGGMLEPSKLGILIGIFIHISAIFVTIFLTSKISTVLYTGLKKTVTCMYNACLCY